MTNTEKHNGIRGIDEGNSITVETTEGRTLDLTCTRKDKEGPGRAAREAGIIRETTLWHFDYDGDDVYGTIIDGLKEREDMADFPRHKALFNTETETNYGFIKSVEHNE